VYGTCDKVRKSFSILNHLDNSQEYDTKFGSDFEHFNSKKQAYKELFDFHAIQEFNQLKDKPFVPFKTFIEAYRDSQIRSDQTSAKSTREQLAQKLKRGQG
jgi:hypothetical protein